MSKEFICKGCGEKFNKDMQSNNIGYCYICNEFYMQKQIADLEAKLAEHNEYFEVFNCKDFNEFQDFISTFMLTPHEEQTLIQELKQQLAEKEEELKEFKSIGATARQLQRAYQDRYKYNDRCCELKNQHIQNKINFAVEQLEKVKELCKKKFDWWENSEWEGDIYDKSDVSNAYFDIEANIDNQIKQLKEGE